MITIDNNTLTEILIRRGSDATRRQVVLAAGELGYTTDTKRLFVGDGITYGGNIIANKFLGYTSIESLSSAAQIGDLAFDPIRNNLYVYTLSGFSIAGVTYGGNITNSGGVVSITNTFAGSGFRIDGSPGVLNLDTTYWTVSTAGISFNKPILTQSLSSNTQITINARPGGSTQFGPALSSDYDLVINGSTFVNGKLSAASGSISINNTGITSATTLSSYTTTVTVNPNLIIQSGGHGSTTTDIVADIQVSPTTSNWKSSFYIDSQPFIGLNITKSAVPLAANVLSTFSVAISGNTIFTNNVTVSGDLTADFLASDINLKENISNISGALEKIQSINGVNFNWKPGYTFTGVDVGVIAQEVESVLPEAVHSRHDGYKGVDYIKIIPLLIQSIKELDIKVKYLEHELDKRCQ